MKIGLLCSNPYATPAYHILVQEGLLCALAYPDDKEERVLPILSLAAEHGIPVSKLSKASLEDDLRTWITQYQPDIVIVLGFPWKIPATVLEIPPMGILNFHYGLLPEMKGPDPLYESIRQRKKQTGITVHKMDARFDNGPILHEERFDLSPEMTVGMLNSQFAFYCPTAVSAVLSILKKGEPLPFKEPVGTGAYWKKTDVTALKIDWNSMDSDEIVALMKATNPVINGLPVAINGWKFGFADGKEITLTGDTSPYRPGTVLTVDMQNGLLVYCKNGKALHVEVVFTDSAVLPGYKLAMFGIQPGMLFD